MIIQTPVQDSGSGDCVTMCINNKRWNLSSRSKSKPLFEELKYLSLSSWCSNRNLEAFPLGLIHPTEGSAAYLSWAFSCSGSAVMPRLDNMKKKHIHSVYSSYFSAAFLLASPEMQNYTKIEVSWNCACSHSKSEGNYFKKRCITENPHVWTS